MLAVPIFRRKLKGWDGLKLTCISMPGIEEVPAPSFGRNQHVSRTLAMSIAIEPRVSQARVQERPGSEVVEIRDAYGNTFAVLVGRRGLREQRVDIGKLRSLGERVDVDSQQMLIETGIA